MYRIKTQEEFEKEYGFLNENLPLKAGWSDAMDYLLGSPITEEQYKEIIQAEKEGEFLQIDDWSISSDMIWISPYLFKSYNIFKKHLGYEV